MDFAKLITLYIYIIYIKRKLNVLKMKKMLQNSRFN